FNNRGIFLLQTELESLLDILVQVNELFKTYSSTHDFENGHLKLSQNIFLMVLHLAESQEPLLLKNLNQLQLPNFRLNSRIYLLFQFSSESFQILEIYTIKGHLFIEKVTIKEDVISTLFLETICRNDFHKIDVVAIGVCNPWGSFDCAESNKTNSFDNGFSVSVYWDLKDSLNFTEKRENVMDYINPDTWNIPFIQFNDSESKINVTNPAWLLAHEHVDLMISQNIYRSSLVSIYTITQPTYHYAIKVYFKQPDPPDVSIFQAPFAKEVWHNFWVFWLCMVLLSFVFKAVESVAIFQETHAHLLNFLGNVCNDVIYSLVGIICSRGCSIVPKSRGMRCLFIISLFGSIFWNSAYQAGYVSILSFQSKTIETFDEVISSGYDLMVNAASVSSPAYAQSVMRAKNISASRLRRIQNVDAIQKLTSGRFAYMEYIFPFYWALQRLALKNFFNPDEFVCKTLSRLDVSSRRLAGGFVLPKKSPYRESFNIK
ncbi:unnamed protein product, partial [Allacma fusca]